MTPILPPADFHAEKWAHFDTPEGAASLCRDGHAARTQDVCEQAGSQLSWTKSACRDRAHQWSSQPPRLHRVPEGLNIAARASPDRRQGLDHHSRRGLCFLATPRQEGSRRESSGPRMGNSARGLLEQIDGAPERLPHLWWPMGNGQRTPAPSADRTGSFSSTIQAVGNRNASRGARRISWWWRSQSTLSHMSRLRHREELIPTVALPLSPNQLASNDNGRSLHLPPTPTDSEYGNPPLGIWVLRRSAEFIEHGLNHTRTARQLHHASHWTAIVDSCRLLLGGEGSIVSFAVPT
jgi:hypothetical protein